VTRAKNPLFGGVALPFSVFVRFAVLLLAATLSGCANEETTTGTTQCATVGCQPVHCGDAGTSCTMPPSTTATTTTTTGPPNVPPVIKVKVTDGNQTTNVTYTDGTLYFDASESTDPDGDGLSAIAIGIRQGNETFDAQLLYSAGAFRIANFTFSKAGPVNVTVSGIDVRGDVTTIVTNVYVDSKTTVGETFQFTGAIPAAAASAKTCKGPAGQAAADNLVWTANGFDLQNGTTYVTAKVVSGTGEIALCAPDGTAISDEGTEVTSGPGTIFAPAAGVSGYYVSVYSGVPNQKVPVEVIVHYEPQT